MKGNAQDNIFKGLAGLEDKLDFNLKGLGGHGWYTFEGQLFCCSREAGIEEPLRKYQNPRGNIYESMSL